MDDFIRGKPAVYSGFDGRLYVATYLHATDRRNEWRVGTLTIANAKGEIVRDVFMAEHKARGFFWNLDAEGKA